MFQPLVKLDTLNFQFTPMKYYKEILSWSERGITVDSLYPEDDWSPLQFACSVGDIDAVRLLLSEGADVNYRSRSMAIPQISSLHIAVRCGHLEIVKLLVMHARDGINLTDQFGFTPVHYAAVLGDKDILQHLLNYGGISDVKSKNGSTPLDIVEHNDIQGVSDLLTSKTAAEKEKSLGKFREWLNKEINAGEFYQAFIDEGFTKGTTYLKKYAFTEQDLDKVGIVKQGTRNLLLTKWKIKNYLVDEDEDDDDEEDDEDEDDEGESGSGGSEDESGDSDES